MSAAAPSAAADMAPWQYGIELARLREFSAVFAERHKRLCFGAFELTRERDIAAAIASGALSWLKDESGDIAAVAIARRLRHSSQGRDFAGRSIGIPAAHVRVTSFAARSAEAGRELLVKLLQRWRKLLWVEIFEEDGTAREALAQLPALKYYASRIAAGSEIKGIYTSAQLGASPLHPAENASVLILREGFAPPEELQAMRAEVFAWNGKPEPWAQHYSSYNRRQSWTAVALRGYDRGDPGFIIKPAEMPASWQEENAGRMGAVPEWTPACAHFKAVLACADRICGGRKPERVRLMRLAPGGELARHADVVNRDAGLSSGRLARLHLPLITSPRVIVHGWDKRGGHHKMAFPAGALCYLDQRKPHRVENNDRTLERVHLVIDVESDGALRMQIAEALQLESSSYSR